MYSLLQQLLRLSLLCLVLSVNTAAAILPNAYLHGHARHSPRQWDRPRLGDVPYGSIIHSCSVPGTVALTFDDGPSAFTPGILDHLAQYHAKATFFVNGDNYGRGRVDDPARPWPDMLRRMRAAGHQIGSHGWRHIDVSRASPEARFEEVVRLEEALAAVLGGVWPTYFRPPFASCDTAGCLADLGELGYHVVNFDVDTKDYEHDSPDGIGMSMDGFAAGVWGSPEDSAYMVLAHDVYAQTTEALVPFMLDTLAERGFRMVTVGECLGDPAENWYRS
ncbi:Glycoside hydrolase/deacetylase [Coniochaeta hoffmannii]|uniref:Glycoside hydrolase/deacetylase n=1 Tax=Coniochaeta hoffmannii TaxID=91930 RepID=A0AA38S8G0_9PEZI|nr:Glycoside hydrolase/deacetylase [Coniochaeta hoffmannii]